MFETKPSRELQSLRMSMLLIRSKLFIYHSLLKSLGFNFDKFDEAYYCKIW